MVYLVTYDLIKPGQDYFKVHEAIKSCGAWWHFLESTWLVDGHLSATEISTRVRAHIDPNDRLLVVGITADYAGWLPQEAWEWINTRVVQHV